MFNQSFIHVNELLNQKCMLKSKQHPVKSSWLLASQKYLWLEMALETSFSYDGALYYSCTTTHYLSAALDMAWEPQEPPHGPKRQRKPVQVALTRTKTMQGIFHPRRGRTSKVQSSAQPQTLLVSNVTILQRRKWQRAEVERGLRRLMGFPLHLLWRMRSTRG